MKLATVDALTDLEHRLMDALSDALSAAECARARVRGSACGRSHGRRAHRAAKSTVPNHRRAARGGRSDGRAMKIAARGHPDRRARARLVILAIAGVLAWVGRRRTTCSIT